MLCKKLFCYLLKLAKLPNLCFQLLQGKPLTHGLFTDSLLPPQLPCQ